MTHEISFIDSHTGGEPTRIVLEGGPDLSGSSVAEKAKDFHERFDHIRTGIVGEPRGNEVLVGGLLVEPASPVCAFGIIFFNNAGFLGMCGHGTIGLVKSLHHLGRMGTGETKIETPVGIISIELHADGKVSFQNVASYRYAADVVVEVPGYGQITGDIGFGGNWFYLVKGHPYSIELESIPALMDFTVAIREALHVAGITGANEALLDHVELYADSKSPGVDKRNFVLCPGMAYDRSPCGTGTSAKLACLYADGVLKENQIWRQESITGSVFDGYVQVLDGNIIPTLKGEAWVTATGSLILGDDDPLQWGIR